MPIEEDALRGQIGSKVMSNFRLLKLSSNLGRAMLDRGQVRNAYRGGCPPRSTVRSKVRSEYVIISECVDKCPSDQRISEYPFKYPYIPWVMCRALQKPKFNLILI